MSETQDGAEQPSRTEQLERLAEHFADESAEWSERAKDRDGNAMVEAHGWADALGYVSDYISRVAYDDDFEIGQEGA